MLLGWGLSAVAGRLEPHEAARVCARPAAILAQAMDKTTDPAALRYLADGLWAVARRLEPQEAARASAQAMAATGYELPYELAEGLWAVAGRLGPQEAARLRTQAAATLIQAIAKSSPTTGTITSPPQGLTESLSAVLTSGDPAEPSRPAAAVGAVGLFAGSGHPLALPLLLAPALQPPLPCRLSTQELVELLKHPTCVGKARRIILDQLENRYHRKFADHWEFVRYAEEQKLGLDFTTPPKRPAPLTGDVK